MRHIILLLVWLNVQLFSAEAFVPLKIQFGCQSTADFVRADSAKGYGAGKVFTESGCIYLNGLDLVYKESDRKYIKVCRKDSPKMCYWTVDTRD